MPVRMLRYSEAIIENVQVNNKGIGNPIVVPIVIYTGKNKWNVETSFAKTQISEEKYQEYKIDLRYKLIDIRKISKEKLIKEETRLSKMMLIEKCRTSKEIRNVLIEILQNAKDEKMIEWIKDMMYSILSRKLEEEVKEEIKEIIRNMEEKKMDEEWERRIQEGDAEEKAKLERKIEKKTRRAEERGEKNGIKTAIKQMVKNMIKHNEKDEKIILYANINKRELNRIKQELKV